MSGITIYEFDALLPARPDFAGANAVHAVPNRVFEWLESQCLQLSDDGETPRLRLTQRCGRRAVQVTSFVGVLSAPDGYQLEVLPKVGKVLAGGVVATRQLLVDMLCCLETFRHVQSDQARIAATRMPLLEVFLASFLQSMDHIVKRGLRSDYGHRQQNLPALRGKLMIAPHLRRNLYRADRFYTAHDEFTLDRPENRLLHSALRRALALTASHANQRLAREQEFAFADVPVSAQTRMDFQRLRKDRGTGYYAEALDWARLLLAEESPLTGIGGYRAPSLLFPMEAVFEAFVAKHLAQQLSPGLILKTQVRSEHLVRHREQHWFRLQPDLLIRVADRALLVLDTKWKLLDGSKANGTDKYGLSQSDFYQLQSYGQNYLDGKGDVVLIYPKTATFNQPLAVFEFPKMARLRLWVLPFCLKSRTLSVPDEAPFFEAFQGLSATSPDPE